MKFFIYILFICTVLLTYSYSYAQINYTSNYVSKKLSTKTALNIKLHQKSIVPHTLIFEPSIDSSYYTVDYFSSTLIFQKKINTDSITVSFRTFNDNLKEKKYVYKYDSVVNLIEANNITTIDTLDNTAAPLLNFGNFWYSGSIGRSLSFGNRQDATVNSNLNLQLNGFIADSIEVTAAISDNNLPIQPDGTTQRLNEFDKILLQFKKKNWVLNMGDIELLERKQYFLNFYKRLQGVSYTNQYKVGKLQQQTTVAGAIAKGKFASNSFNGKEGNQGPYKLQIPDAKDLYIIILAGSERVYIDGVLQQRGEDREYVINYNTAEIMFMPKQMITKDKRIQIEFEYADRNYLNTLLYASQNIVANKFQVNVSAYRSSDIKTSPINQTLNALQQNFLANIGDSVQLAYYPAAYIDSFTSNKILYAKKPNTATQTPDSIYVYSTNPAEAKYNLYFSEVGVNKGNYIQWFNGVNGKVYKYIAPKNGVPQGNFEPAQFLATPKMQQVIAANTTINISPKTTLFANVAYSYYNANLFSSLHQNNNNGLATKLYVQNSQKLSAKENLQTVVGYEYVGKQFKPLERLRSVEFNRNWSLPNFTSAATEHLPYLSFTYDKEKSILIKYFAEGYFRSDGFKGVKNNIEAKKYIKDAEISTQLFLVNNTSITNKGYFLKPTISVQKNIKWLKNSSLQLQYIAEKNYQKWTSYHDSLMPQSFAFNSISAKIKTNNANKNNIWFEFFTRADKLPLNNQLTLQTQSYNYIAGTELLKKEKHQFKLTANYRQLFNKLPNANKQPETTILGRAEHLLNTLKGLYEHTTLYEIGTGQEQKRDITYFEVPAGKGEYTWIDYNNDGIKQLNEFEVATFKDQAKFAKLFTPTNQYVKTNYTQLSYSATINPKNISTYIKSNAVKQLVERLYFQTSTQIILKNNNQFWFNILNKNFADSSLLAYSNTSNHTFWFNRFSNVWGLDVNYFKQEAKNLMAYGFEAYTSKAIAAKARWKITSNFMLECLYKTGNNLLQTPKFSNRNYDIKQRSIEPKLQYNYSNVFRGSVGYKYAKKNNDTLYGNELCTINSFISEFKFNTVKQFSLFAKFNYSQIAFSGINNTTLSYTMLEGLQPGKNYILNIDFNKRLLGNIDVTISYEGRKSNNNNMVHLGQAGVRAML